MFSALCACAHVYGRESVYVCAHTHPLYPGALFLFYPLIWGLKGFPQVLHLCLLFKTISLSYKGTYAFVYTTIFLLPSFKIVGLSPKCL